MRRSDKIITTCAVTGGAPFNPKHPSFPITPKQIAASVIEAAQAGAAIAHIHVRDPQTNGPSRDPKLFKEVVDRVRDTGVDIILNLTGGGGGVFYPDPDNEARGLPQSDVASLDERMEHIEECRPEIASLDINTSNQVEGGDEYVYLNTTRTLRGMADRYKAAGVKPELEVFSSGDIEFGKQLIAESRIAGKPLFQFVTGVQWQVPADTLGLYFLKQLLPENAIWGALGVGREEMPVAAQSAILGGHIRVGLEDNLYLRRGVFASNGELVTQVRDIMHKMGYQTATPAQAREILGL